MKTCSPLRAIRRASGLSVADFSALLQVQPPRIYQAETSSSIPSGILGALEARGVDCVTLVADQREWGAERAQAVQAAGPDLRRAQLQARAAAQ